MIMISQDCHVKSIGEEVHVLFFDKIDAKNIKNKLEENGFLNKEFRMTTCSSNELYIGCIAAPLVLDVDESIINSLFLETNVIRGFGIQFCPYSTSSLGNHTTVRSLTRKQTPSDKASITLVQSGIMKAFSEFLNQNKIVVNISRNISDILIEIEENLLELNQISCPKTLQYLGDDKTLILPLKSFDIERDVAVGSFISSSLQKCMTDSDHKNCVEFVNCYLWKSLAYTFSSSRVVRRGEINPNSKIRLSEYKILWFSIDNTNNYYNPKITTGPGSPGWITVTEQGVRQSFDLTKVMFSRGNITEKIRFGKLVQPGETVLDLYAGIGYFTLPALLHGGAECVYACEWNEEAGKFSILTH